MNINDITLEEAKNAVSSYDYVLAYELSRVVFDKACGVKIHWDECTEAFFFNEVGQIHLYLDEGNLVGKKITAETDDDCYVDKQYSISSKFDKVGKKIVVRDYLGFDEDGQAYVKYSMPVCVR